MLKHDQVFWSNNTYCDTYRSRPREEFPVKNRLFTQEIMSCESTSSLFWNSQLRHTGKSPSLCCWEGEEQRAHNFYFQRGFIRMQHNYRHDLPSNGKLLYSVQEAAHVLGVSRSTIYAYIEKGWLIPVHINSRAQLSRETLERFVQEADLRARVEASSRAWRP